MPKHFTAYTTVRGEYGDLVSFRPGDLVPEWVEDRVTNPDAFTEADPKPTDTAKPARKPRAKAKPKPEPEPEPDTGEDEGVKEEPAEEYEPEGPDFTKPAPKRTRRTTTSKKQ